MRDLFSLMRIPQVGSKEDDILGMTHPWCPTAAVRKQLPHMFTC